MIYTRRYVQFNNLVFDGYDMISDGTVDVGFKSSTTPYPYSHGSYVAFKSEYMYAEEQTVSMTLKLKMKKLPCDMRPFYRSFAIGELTRVGKLWAVQNNELVWAFAFISNYAESTDSIANVLEIDVDFVVYEGVWHKADKQKTFLKPYDVCSFLDCYDFQTIDPCEKKSLNCCVDCFEKNEYKGCDCDKCTNVDPEWALCLHKDLQGFYACNGGYQIEYNCRKGQEYFGDDYLGTKICKKDSCSTVIAGQVYSDTDIPTTGITIVLSGGGNNTAITINDNTNIIKGDYDGVLTITPSGDIIHTKDCCDIVLDPSVVEIPQGNTWGFEMHRGKNRVIIENGGTCAYIQVDSLTI